MPRVSNKFVNIVSSNDCNSVKCFGSSSSERERETVEDMATKEDEATGTHIEERGIDEHCSLLLGQ
jgi:hypothetical protein